MTPIEEIGPLDAAAFDAEVRPAHRPVVIRGVARDWPLVEAALRSPHESLDYPKSLDAGAATGIMVVPPAVRAPGVW